MLKRSKYGARRLSTPAKSYASPASRQVGRCRSLRPLAHLHSSWKTCVVTRAVYELDVPVNEKEG